ncbi:MAG: Asp-tRNA(Asn)/Glu-tRNA(Gln) amidotransferase subunit GatC [Patescibacteria group bacterium]|nr:Asp-tRNA(Asn)/Glu-tRNA(Gln) amidotransferase subunit GatC [Patescibacteria group bacterium]
MKRKTKITIEEVKHIAQLAKLPLSEKEIAKFQEQLTDIIDFVDQLKKLNTDKILPTTQVTGLKNVFRKDAVTPSLTQEEVLSNTKSKYKGYFKVKAIL